MDKDLKSPEENLIDTIEDLIIEEDVLYTNNTFNLNALNQTLEKLALTNFWSLYQNQRSRLQIERFDLKFSDFVSTFRLVGEQSKNYYPKRYVAYINYTFIHPGFRKKFRNSKFYNTPINQETIASNPDIFKWNYLIFIDGEFVYTTEAYPLESKMGIVIDVASPTNKHGISYDLLTNYLSINPNVTIFVIPNYNISTVTSNKYVLKQYDNSVPFTKVIGSKDFNSTTMCFMNSKDDEIRKYLEDGVSIDLENEVVTFDDTITPGSAKYRMCFVTFNHLHSVLELTKDNPFFELKTEMPCPKEHMIIMVKQNDGKYLFNKDITIKMYYPNIYEIIGLNDGETGIVYVLQDENTVTDSEKYLDELKKYREYIDILPRYKDNSIHEIIKHYQPSSFVYSIDDYRGSVMVPNTMNYKVQKLHETIYKNPWALAVYLDLLNLPSDKFYLDMEKIDLSDRIRQDSSNEDIDSGVSIAYFKEDMYVFAMNRHFVDTRAYSFRIFIDGLFQIEPDYVVLPGPNYYYIYLPVSKITPTSMIEIERYKLFTFETQGSTISLDLPITEIDFSNWQMVGYSREIYVVDAITKKYLTDSQFRVEVLYKFAERGNKWVTIPPLRNIPIENKVRVYVTDENFVDKPLRIGIQRNAAMHVGDVYSEGPVNNAGGYEYTRAHFANTGGYDKGGYRVFNNGKMLLPIQYYVSSSKRQGDTDIVITSCAIYTGDRFTIDHVPTQFRAIYYQNEIDIEDKKGYVDLDGKIPLPISLKWYDIYLNGIKLNKKNIEIITPTKFYIQGVDSRKHLLIVVRNRDPEVFKLPSHTNPMDKLDWNNTVIDDLLETTNELKKLIDAGKSVIDPNNETREIATEVALNINAIIFFYEELFYSFINANRKQITQDIKETFPMLLTENDNIWIDSNAGCVPSNEVGGYLIKLIECNSERSDDMFTDENVNYGDLGALQDRFAIRPLSTDNYAYSLPAEFMTDPETGEPAIVNDDGTVTSISTVGRLKNFIESFNSNMIIHGMGKADIYQLTFDNEYKVLVYKGGNLLSEEIEIPKIINKLCIGIDTTFLTKIGEDKMLKITDITPSVVITLNIDGVEKEYITDIHRVADTIIEIDSTNVKLISVVLNGIPDNVKTFVHSLLLAF